MLQWTLFHNQWRISTQQLGLPLVPCVSLAWTPVTVEITHALSAMREGVTQHRPPSVLLVSVLLKSATFDANCFSVQGCFSDPSIFAYALDVYRIAPNFRGKIFSQISLLQFFAEINFADQGFPLAMPSLGGRLIHYLLIVAATPCSATCFALLVELHLGPSWFIRLSSSTTRLKP